MALYLFYRTVAKAKGMAAGGDQHHQLKSKEELATRSLTGPNVHFSSRLRLTSTAMLLTFRPIMMYTWCFHSGNPAYSNQRTGRIGSNHRLEHLHPYLMSTGCFHSGNPADSIEMPGHMCSNHRLEQLEHLRQIQFRSQV